LACGAEKMSLALIAFGISTLETFLLVDDGQTGSYRSSVGLVPTNALVSSERSLITGCPETGLCEALKSAFHVQVESQIALAESPAFDRIAFA
jgi:hypothetical protein